MTTSRTSLQVARTQILKTLDKHAERRCGQKSFNERTKAGSTYTSSGDGVSILTKRARELRSRSGCRFSGWDAEERAIRTEEKSDDDCLSLVRDGYAMKFANPFSVVVEGEKVGQKAGSKN